MLIFLDLETTGLEAKDRICACAMIVQADETLLSHYELIKPPKKLRPTVMAVHHITNEMVADAPAFPQSETLRLLSEYNIKENILVAHNAAFDLQMLEREGVIWQGDVIDTLKCTKHLIEECEQYGLQFLRYELRLYKHEAAAAAALGIGLMAHHALSDALHVKLLYEYLLELRSEVDLIALTRSHALVLKFGFGKYKGRYIEEIAMSDAGYLTWMLDNMFDMDSDLRYSVEYFLYQNRGE